MASRVVLFSVVASCVGAMVYFARCASYSLNAVSEDDHGIVHRFFSVVVSCVVAMVHFERCASYSLNAVSEDDPGKRWRARGRISSLVSHGTSVAPC